MSQGEANPFVDDSKLANLGASGRALRLKSSTSEGAKEVSVIKAHEQACAFIRLANNIEIGMEVCASLVNRSKQSFLSFFSLFEGSSEKFYLASLNMFIH